MHHNLQRKTIASLMTATLALFLLVLLDLPAHAETDKYRLVWTDDPTTTITIGWGQVSGTATGVKYGTDPGLATYDTNTTLTTRTYDNILHPEGAALVSYFVTLTGLTPDTVYYFRTYDSEGDNTIYWFKTAPDDPQAVTFIAGGDSRTHQAPRQWGNQLVAKLRPLFVAFGGDYHDDCTNDEMREWLDDWQLTISSDNRIYPIIPAHGNHENDMIDFVELIFNMPNPDAYYAASVGGNLMRLYSLNSELEPGVGYGAFTDQDDTKWNAQADWLAADMAANPGFTWKIGQFHRPMRPHQAGKPEGLGRIEAWAQTMYDNGMDLVIDCDSHMMKYTYPLAPSENAGSFESFVRDDADGTMFIGEGSWGAPHRANDDDKPWTLSSDTGWQFKLIQADATNIFIRTVRFGQYDDTGSPDLGYTMADVAELTQTEQDTDAFAMPAGLDAILWKPLAGSVITLNATGDLFTGADVDNVEYVSTGDTWAYLDDGSDQGTAWTDPTYDDSAWATGDAQLGYGDGDETTVISYGSDADNKYITAYFRKDFSVTDASQVIKLKAMILRDDGAVVYINGSEAFRTSMPDGDITYTTLANDAGSETTYYEYNIDPALLVNGSNTIAVEVHQSGATSSDTSFDMVLVGVESNLISGTAPAAPTLLAETSTTTTTIDIEWTDNASDEVGYELWRKVADGAWEILEPSLAADTVAYGDTMLSEGTAYAYKVRAYSAAGLSAFSDEISVTTLTASTPLVYGEDFNTGAFGQFATVSVTSSADWAAYEYPTGSGEWFARINGYGADMASDDWLISPELNLYAYDGEYLTADLAYNYDGPEIEVLVSDNYDPDVHTDPNDAHWTSLPASMPSVGGYAFETTGALSVDLAAVNFDDDTFGSFTPYSVASSADWVIEERADKLGAVANGFGADAASDDWLISPAMSVGAGAGIEIAFNLYRKYGGPELQVMVSTDYTGSGDPTLATWDSYAIPHDDIYDAWKYVSVTHAFASDATAYVAFRYTTTGVASGDGARLGVDDVVIQPTAARVAFHYLSTGTGGGDGRVWEVDNVEFRGNRVSYASEDFNEDLISATTFTAYSAASSADWIIEERGGQKGAIANGYGADGASDDWLISPAMLLAPEECAELVFDHYRKYDGPALQVMISTDYDGSADPMDGSSTWDAVEISHDDIDDTWASRTVDLCDHSGTVYVAFRYTTTGTGSGDGARIGVDNVQVVRKAVTELAVDFTGNPTTATTHDAAVTFTAYVSGGTAPYAYAWDFGNGDTSAEENPAYTYPAAGTYTVGLCVTDAESAVVCNTKTDLITVEEGTFYDVKEVMGLRVATFNCYLNRSSEGEIVTDLTSGTDEQIQKVAEIIQRVNPDVILLNEFDYVADGSAVTLLKQNYLEVSQNGANPITFDHSFIAESNTGIDSGLDLNDDGSFGTADDCYGYGEFYGQYGMAFLSKYPIDTANIRTFQMFLWKDMPDNVMPTDYYDATEQAIFRLSSKSHWDVPVDVDGTIIHMLCSHPTPPTFDDGDADEDPSLYDWNGKRNHDEIRFWADYVDPAESGYIYDDSGVYGGLGADERFVILGDENADPDEGDSYQNAILQLLNSSLINSNFIPESLGAVDYGIDSDDTASWGMRADYNLPSVYGFKPLQGEVFWPTALDDLFYLVDADGSSDHRLVWMDLMIDTGLIGDLNADCIVNFLDFGIFRQNYGQTGANIADLNGDEIVNFLDFGILRQNYGSSCPE